MSFNAVMAAYLSAGLLEQAVAVLEAMHVPPTAATFLQLQAAAARLNEPTAALHAWSLARAQRVPLHIDMLNLHMGCLIRVVRLPFTLAPECRGCGAPSVHASVLART